MKYKIYTIGTYLFMHFPGKVDPLQDSKGDVRVRLIDSVTGLYVITSPKLGRHEVLLSAIDDFDDVAYDLASWELFYECETAFSRASGSGAFITATDLSVGATALALVPAPVEFDTIVGAEFCPGIAWIDIGGSPGTFNTLKVSGVGILRTHLLYQLDRATGVLNSCYFAVREVDNLGVEIAKLDDSLRVDKVDNTGLDGVGIDCAMKVKASVNTPRYFQFVMWASGAGNFANAVTIDGYLDNKMLSRVWFS